MIIIGEPKIVKSNKNKRLSCDIEINGKRKNIWLELDNRYSKFFIKDRCDAFLIAMLPIAMNNKKDIICQFPVSEELLHNLTVQLIPALLNFDKSLYKTRISAEPNKHLVKPDNAVGTYVSTSPGSIHTISRYIETPSKPFKLTHLVKFDNDISQSSQKDYVDYLSNEYRLPIININTNLQDEFPELLKNYQIYYNMFPILATQKLWKLYYCSTNSDLQTDNGITEYLTVNCINNYNFKMILEGIEKNYFEKINDISDDIPSKKYLHVCNSEQENCGRCDSCINTILTLESIGKLEDFEKIFDIDYYKHNKKLYLDYIEKKHANKNKTTEAIYQQLKRTGKLIGSPPTSFVPNLKLPQIKTTSLIIKNLRTNKLILEKSPQDYCSAVAFAKILTAIIALESGKTQFNIDLQEKLFEKFQKISLYDLINILLITQNNEVSVIIAEAVAGTTGDFVNLMNEKMKSIGAYNSKFTTLTGLGADSYTTAEDCVKLMEYVIQNKHFCEIFKRKSYKLHYDSGEKIISALTPVLKPKNEYFIPECTGAKYGICGNYGNIAAILEYGNNIYLAVLLDSKADKTNFNIYKDIKVLSECILKQE